MPVKPRVVRRTRNQIPAGLIRYFEIGEIGDKGTDWAVYTGLFEWVRIPDLWDQVKVGVLSDWVKGSPCSRPFMWWEADAPREPVAGWEGDRFACAQRRRIGGTGTATHEVLASWADFEYGLPTSWIDEWEAAYYNGMAVDVNGDPIGREHKPGDFEGMAIDPQAPPTFESQAVYLQRKGLLTQQEKSYLVKHPEFLRPEIINF